MEIIEPLALMNFVEGTLEGDDVVCGRKTLKDNAAIYLNTENCDMDTVVYDVFSYNKAQPGRNGDLLWGMTVLYPVQVNGECNMTRGHWHVDRDNAEFYFGITGQGLLMLMDENGKCWCEKVFPGSLHYIDGIYAHRLINTSETETMKVGACWPVTAGHDYAATEKQPFTTRIFLKNGQIETLESEK